MIIFEELLLDKDHEIEKEEGGEPPGSLNIKKVFSRGDRRIRGRRGQEVLTENAGRIDDRI